MIFEDTVGGVDGTKALIHARKWDVYNLEKQELVKGGYSVEVSDKDRKRVIWEVIDDHVVEQGVDHKELCLRSFDFNLSHEEREGCIGYDVKELPHLLILMKLWPGYWEQQLDRMKKKVDENNGREGTQENGRFQNLRQISRNEFWNNIWCLLSAPTFGLGGSIL